MKLIAELGSNWKTFDDCKNAISLAKAAGADAIKFQLYTHAELYGTPGTLPGEMPREWIPRLAEKARATDIEFMCTAFSHDGVRFVDPYVDTHKLASSEMCHRGMLDALKATGKPLIVSTGAQTQRDITNVAEYLAGRATTWLYCEAAYPSRHSDLRRMAQLAALIQAPVGYSDHTLDVYNAPLIAQALGAVILEKHFNPFDYTDTPDAGHSLSTEDFLRMVHALKGIQEPLGPTRAEMPMVLSHKRRLIATRAIALGEALTPENHGAYRYKHQDTEALHPMVNSNGLRTIVSINPGSPIRPQDVR